MEIFRKEFIAIRFVLELSHDLRSSVAEREDAVVSHPFIVDQVNLAQYDLMFIYLISNVHGFLGKLADRLSIFGHRFVPIGLVCLLFFGSAINNPS